MSDPWPQGTRLLHVFGAEQPHGEVVIVGTQAALRQVQAAVTAALDGGHGVTRGVMQRDGEGFWCFVVLATEARMERVPLAYHDEVFGDPEAQLPPWIVRRCEAAAQAAMAARRAAETQETKSGST